MTDDQIAIAHLALIDAESAEDAVRWQEHWEDQWDAMRLLEHHGDCTQVPMTCSRCLADEALVMVPIYRALFDLPGPF